MLSQIQKTKILKSHKYLTFGLLNARSVVNKTETIVDFIKEHDLDPLLKLGYSRMITFQLVM